MKLSKNVTDFRYYKGKLYLKVKGFKKPVKISSNLIAKKINRELMSN